MTKFYGVINKNIAAVGISAGVALAFGMFSAIFSSTFGIFLASCALLANVHLSWTILKTNIHIIKSVYLRILQDCVNYSEVSDQITALFY